LPASPAYGYAKGSRLLNISVKQTFMYFRPLVRIMSRMNTHALSRLNTRLTDAEKVEVISNVKAVVEVVGSQIDVAVYALKLDAHRASNCDSKSNGQNIVAVVRKGVIRTVMLRRDNQPATRDALRVDKIVRMA